ncbi:MAG TPA: hypothetical protein VGL07_04960 [Buttiauxella sp.]|jgi:hypothetical protein
MTNKRVGIYCTVNSEELALAIMTLTYSAQSEYVRRIIIVQTDSFINSKVQLTDKITLYTRNFGKGYDLSITEGGYDQIAARNFALDILYDCTDIDWVMLHDADDLYLKEGYRNAFDGIDEYDALTCSCLSLKGKNKIRCSARKSFTTNEGIVLHDPHTRIWKKNLGLHYEMSSGIEQTFSNVSRHCGVFFSHGITFCIFKHAWHFHLHALFNKRHTDKISDYPFITIELPEEVKDFIKKLNI